MILIQVKDKLKEPKIVSQPGDKAVAGLIEVEGASVVAITSVMPDEERQNQPRTPCSQHGWHQEVRDNCDQSILHALCFHNILNANLHPARIIMNDWVQLKFGKMVSCLIL